MLTSATIVLNKIMMPMRRNGYIDQPVIRVRDAKTVYTVSGAQSIKL